MKMGWSPKHLPRPDSIVLAAFVCSSKQVEPGMFPCLMASSKMWYETFRRGNFAFLPEYFTLQQQGEQHSTAEMRRRTERQQMDPAALLCEGGNWGQPKALGKKLRLNCKRARLARRRISLSKPFAEVYQVQEHRPWLPEQPMDTARRTGESSLLLRAGGMGAARCTSCTMHLMHLVGAGLLAQVAFSTSKPSEPFLCDSYPKGNSQAGVQRISKTPPAQAPWKGSLLPALPANHAGWPLRAFLLPGQD